MQEFLGLKYNIESSKRVRSGFRITTFSSGYLTFKFPKALPKSHIQAQAQEYIQENYNNILNTLKKLKERENKIREKKEKIRQEKDNYIESYLKNNPNSLFIFNKTYEISSLNIESLSQILYAKADTLLDMIAAAMDLERPPLRISATKGYLGQCRRDVIKIDYRNVLSSENLLIYLIVHELSHLRHMNHSKAFWEHVATYYPNYKQAKKELIKMADYNAQILKHYNLLPKKLH